MPSSDANSFLSDFTERFGQLKALPGSRSMFELVDSAARIYIRYSKLHERGQTFYGLRNVDLRCLQGYLAFICFIWPGQIEPLVIPFDQFEDIFFGMSPASDGQYKAQVYTREGSTEFYISGAGRFGVSEFLGWSQLELTLEKSNQEKCPDLGHAQVQTLLGAIGHRQGFDIWLPSNNRACLDWSLTSAFECRRSLPESYRDIMFILEEIDVIWLVKGGDQLASLFEIEHSTSIYSGLLRFNDVLLTMKRYNPRFSIVADDVRRSVFARQVNRPTFKANGLNESCSFLEYSNVFSWHRRVNL